MPDADDAELLVDFLNSVDYETGADALADPASHAAWAAKHGLSAGDRADAVRVRDALRRALGQTGIAEPGALPVVEVTAGPEGLAAASADVASAVLAAGIRLSATGTWNRIKICPGEDCAEAFLDASKNASRTWCDMAVCGNLAKARAYRERRRRR